MFGQGPEPVVGRRVGSDPPEPAQVRPQLVGEQSIKDPGADTDPTPCGLDNGFQHSRGRDRQPGGAPADGDRSVTYPGAGRLADRVEGQPELIPVDTERGPVDDIGSQEDVGHDLARPPEDGQRPLLLFGGRRPATAELVEDLRPAERSQAQAARRPGPPRHRRIGRRPPPEQVCRTDRYLARRSGNGPDRVAQIGNTDV